MLPRPLARFKGPTSKGKEGKGRGGRERKWPKGRGGEEKERKGKERV